MARPQEAALDASVDALSDVLDLIHLRGEGLTLVHADGSVDLSHSSDERLVHLIQQGPVDLSIDKGDVVRLDGGDLVLLANGAAHRLTSKGGSWMTGRFVVEETAAHPLLAVLPQSIVIRGSEPGLEWSPLAAGLLAVEMDNPSAGSRVMVSRLLDLVFIHVLRAWSARGEIRDPGWLTAALDRALGPAVRAIHRHPEEAWSVEQLADLSSMSRAAFAARFGTLMGESPGRYLARLRLARAADHLAGTTETVGSIGKAVGYESEAAFSRAFAREFGQAPRDWRAAQRD